MSKRIEYLTEQQLIRAEPGEKPRKLFDGGGLYVHVLPTGLKIWRMKFHDDAGKEKTLTLGRYPEVSMELASYRRSVAREMLKGGQDPRTKFDRAHIRSPARVGGRRLLPASIDKRKLDLHAGHIGMESVDRIGAFVFPAAYRLSAEGDPRRDMLALLEKIQRERRAEVVELLYDICAEVVRSCVDSGIDESALIDVMNDARVKHRRFA